MKITFGKFIQNAFIFVSSKNTVRCQLSQHLLSRTPNIRINISKILSNITILIFISVRRTQIHGFVRKSRFQVYEESRLSRN